MTTVEADDQMSDEPTRNKKLPAEAEFYVLNLGCDAGSLVMNCWDGMQLEHIKLTGRPEIDSDPSNAKRQRRGPERGEVNTGH